MPRHTGLELIKYVRDHFQNICIIMLTGYGSIDSAVAAMKEGADEYITKPFTDKELLDAVEKSILKLKEKKTDPALIYDDTWTRFDIIGQSQNMLEMYSKIEKACQNDATVLITGENGTGKNWWLARFTIIIRPGLFILLFLSIARAYLPAFLKANCSVM